MSLIEQIKKKSNLSEDEINSKIKEKISKYPGLFTEESAAYVLAKELGIVLEDKDVKLTPLNIIDNTIKTANVNTVVEYIFPPKEYVQGSKKSKYVRLIVREDDTTVNLTLWDKFVPLVETKKIKKGSILACKNLSVNKYKNKISLGTTSFSDIQVTGEKKIEPEQKRINDLSESDFFVKVEAKLVSKRELRNINSSKVINFRLYDGFYINASAWDDAAEEVNKIDIGKTIVIEGAYVRRRQKLELNVPSDAKISTSSKAFEVVADADLPLKNISELAYGERVRLKGTIKGLDRLVSYNWCDKCNKKAEDVCACGNKDLVKNYIVGFIFGDESATTKAILFRNQISALLGLQQDITGMTEDEVSSKLSTVLDKDKEFLGYLKKNTFSGEDEFIVMRVVS
ncbi:MAG: hypothetical protein PHH82_00400 [Candidatus ainarchaeum sp.]|nr:hypothetical protein [Candidatus ainarchaeum sp.]